ncbi:MAG TPA: glycoside hydrolase family 25 protein [Anaerolineales bacterium]|nr:glycoside hydrolase family 25 protein [Anaerolineales bacterium]
MRAALVDASRYQGMIDAAKIKAAGFCGIVARCTIGFLQDGSSINRGLDFYRNSQQQARDNGLIFGGYHVLRPENRNPIREAQNYAASAGVTDLDVVDIELMVGQTARSVVDQAKMLIDQFETLHGRKPIIYTGSWFWDGAPYIGPVTPAGWEQNYALWEAEYTKSIPRGGIEPSLAPIGEPGDLSDGFDGWKFWQWTSGGKPYGVQSESLDYDIFNGTEEELRQFLGLTAPPPTLEERVAILEREAIARDWNLAP